MLTRVPVPLVFSLVAMSALLTACGGGPDVIETDDVAVLVDHDYDGSMDALLRGRLANVDGCLGVDPSEVPVDYAVIWPDGIEVVREEPFTVRLADGNEYAIGDEIALGGGEGGFLDREADIEPGDFCPGVPTWRAH